MKAPYDDLELAIQYSGSGFDEDAKIDNVKKEAKKIRDELDPKSSKAINDVLLKKKVIPKPLEKTTLTRVFIYLFINILVLSCRYFITVRFYG